MKKIVIFTLGIIALLAAIGCSGSSDSKGNSGQTPETIQSQGGNLQLTKSVYTLMSDIDFSNSEKNELTFDTTNQDGKKISQNLVSASIFYVDQKQVFFADLHDSKGLNEYCQLLILADVSIADQKITEIQPKNKAFEPEIINSPSSSSDDYSSTFSITFEGQSDINYSFSLACTRKHKKIEVEEERAIVLKHLGHLIDITDKK